jgi:hypothetical protein
MHADSAAEYIAMAQDTIEKRVARLEKQVSLLIGNRTDGDPPSADAWQQTVGMFRGDPIVREMIEEARRIREEDRRKTRETTESASE